MRALVRRRYRIGPLSCRFTGSSVFPAHRRPHPVWAGGGPRCQARSLGTAFRSAARAPWTHRGSVRGVRTHRQDRGRTFVCACVTSDFLALEATGIIYLVCLDRDVPGIAGFVAHSTYPVSVHWRSVSARRELCGSEKLPFAGTSHRGVRRSLPFRWNANLSPLVADRFGGRLHRDLQGPVRRVTRFNDGTLGIDVDRRALRSFDRDGLVVSGVQQAAPLPCARAGSGANVNSGS